MLRAIGASRRQVLRSVLVEAVAIGDHGFRHGLVAGIGVAMGLRALFCPRSASTLPDGRRGHRRHLDGRGLRRRNTS